MSLRSPPITAAVSSSPALAVTRLVIVAMAVLLIVNGVAWEAVLAPVRPGAWRLALKVLPLAIALPALWRARVRTYQWWSMAVLAYVGEGVVRASSDQGIGATLAGVETVLGTVMFVALLAHVRLARADSRPRPV